MKYSIEEFAAQIRDLYPGDYDDLSDNKLVSLWLKKYPNDIKKVDLNNKKESQSFSFIWIIACVIIGGGIFLLTNNINSNNKKSSTLNQADVQKTPHETKSDFFQTISINPEIAKKIDESVIIARFDSEVDDDLKTKIKKILSDPNPDPENKSGEICGNDYSNCKYCGKEFPHPKKFQSAKYLINIAITNPITAPFFAHRISILESTSNKQEFRSYLLEISDNFQSGNKYTCIVEDENEFCSKKCKDDNRYNSR